MQQAKDEVPPLAVYHICRICLRPRSARYHQEHPIPIDGVPPPPGICRRCRVVAVDDSKVVTQIMEQPESKDVKLGVKCLVPDVDYVTNGEMRSRRASYVFGQEDRVGLGPSPPEKSRQSNDPRPNTNEEIVYRHVHITAPPLPPVPHYTPPGAHSSFQASAKQGVRDAEGSVSRNSSFPEMSVDPAFRAAGISPPLSPPLAAGATLSKPDTLESPFVSNAATLSRSRRASVRCVSTMNQSEQTSTESEIRRLAREEVIRYRQAERSIEAHKEPYAHGRLIPVERRRVPIERRIELQTDIANNMPWRPDFIEIRRDSAFAAPTQQRKYAEHDEGEGVVRTHWADQAPTNSSKTVSIRPSSSCPSDRTRWPAAKIDHTYHVIKDERQSDKGTQYYKPTRRRSDAPELEMEPRESALQPQHVTIDTPEVERPSAHSQSSKWTEREYWEYAGSGWTDHRALKKRSDTVAIATAEAQVVGRKVKPGSGSQARHEEGLALERNSRKDKGHQDLPYPCDDHATIVPMPSPSSHASRPARSGKKIAEDGDYFYIVRTVKPVSNDSRPSEAQPGDYCYRNSSEYVHRRKLPRDQVEALQCQTQANHPKINQRRLSDASSRVRFEKKLDISPTPPGSDASSAQFRNFIGRKNLGMDVQGPERRKDPAAEYERRGRQRSRTPSGARGICYERDIFRSRERRYRMERDMTPQPVALHGGPHPPSETATGLSTLPSNIRPIARALSESPSREWLRAAALRQKSDGLPPYVEPVKPAASVTVEDGSTLTSESSGSYRREVEVSRQQGGRRLKR